jgi:hypothetical protein
MTLIGHPAAQAELSAAINAMLAALINENIAREIAAKEAKR